MDRKLTEKEKAFLQGLADLLLEYNTLMSIEDGCIDFDVEDIAVSEDTAVHVPASLTITGCDLEEFIEQNS